MEVPTTPLIISINDLSWFSGRWKYYPHGDDLLEEHWTDIEYSHMLGMFRWIKDGNIFVTEHMKMVQTSKGILLYLRHFDENFHSWEEKSEPIVLYLVRYSNGRAFFRRKDAIDSGWFLYEIENTNLKFSDYNEDGSIAFNIAFEKV